MHRISAAGVGILFCSSIATPAVPAKGNKASKTDQKQTAEGVQTPGIQLSMTELKSEADIVLTGPVSSMLFADAVFVASNSSDIVKVDLKSNQSEAFGKIDKPCGSIGSGFGSLWVPSCGNGTLKRIDLKTKKELASIPVTSIDSAKALTTSPDSVWLLADNLSTLVRIDPEENAVVAEIRLPKGCNSVGFGANALWVTCPSENQLLKIDPATNLVAKRIEVSGEPFSATVAGDSAWVLCRTKGDVVRIDTKTNKVAATVSLNIPQVQGEITSGEGFIWVSARNFPISRIDPETEKVVQQFKGETGNRILAAGGSVWVGGAQDGKLVRIDTKRIKAVLAP
jgi:virginiamycin B lyase